MTSPWPKVNGVQTLAGVKRTREEEEQQQLEAHEVQKRLEEELLKTKYKSDSRRSNGSASSSK